MIRQDGDGLSSDLSEADRMQSERAFICGSLPCTLFHAIHPIAAK
jgi:hypothetical protein